MNYEEKYKELVEKIKVTYWATETTIKNMENSKATEMSALKAYKDQQFVMRYQFGDVLEESQ